MTQVSVIMPSYNHSRFIKDAIESVLSQSMGDLELIIVDDGSRDNSNEIVAAIRDDRVIHIPLEKNVGACEAMNIALDRCQSEFVAVCNSDDIWEKNKLELQLQQIKLMPNVGAVFSDVVWVNDEGEELSGSSLPHFSRTFAEGNRSRFGWLKYLIECGNHLCHPSVLIRRSIYNIVGNYDNMLRQLPDLAMWLKVLQLTEIHVMSDRLVRFRIHDNNTSQQSDANKARTWREHTLIAKTFFTEVTPDNFYGSFGFTDLQSFRSSDPVVFLRQKINYLTTSDCVFRELFHDIAVEMAYFESKRLQVAVIPALEFQNISAAVTRETHQLGVLEKKRPLKALVGPMLYEKLRSLNVARKHRRAYRRSNRPLK